MPDPAVPTRGNDQSGPSTSANRSPSVSTMPEPTNADMIRAICLERGVTTLCHFTWRGNLPSIFRNGLVSRSYCEQLAAQGEQCFHLDGLRLDGHRGSICLSITHPNYKMFWSYRAQSHHDYWCVFLLKPDVLWEKPCSFYFRNAAHSTMSARNKDKMASADAFEGLFYSHLLRAGEKIEGTERNQILNGNEPTNPQAEVLVFDRIELGYVEKVAFLTRAGVNAALTECAGISISTPLVVETKWFDARRDYADWQS